MDRDYISLEEIERSHGKQLRDLQKQYPSFPVDSLKRIYRQERRVSKAELVLVKILLF